LDSLKRASPQALVGLVLFGPQGSESFGDRAKGHTRHGERRARGWVQNIVLLFFREGVQFVQELTELELKLFGEGFVFFVRENAAFPSAFPSPRA
jgi:hypothetical protein